MNKVSIGKILNHPDREEIISKIVIGFSAKDINEWLKSKYSGVSESKFVLSEKMVKTFQDEYLDMYKMIKEDIAKTKTAMVAGTEENLELAIKDSSAYKSAMIQMANKEVDIKKMITNLCITIETRLAQIFDSIQEDPRNIDTKIDRVFLEYVDRLGVALERYYKIVEQGPDQVIHHNITLQAVDQHVAVFHDVIKDVLAQMDHESAMYFMEVFRTKMAKIKPPSDAILTQEAKFAEVKILNEEISRKINEE